MATNSYSLDLEIDNAQYVYASDSPSLSITGDLSLELWIKLESSLAVGAVRTLVGKWYHAGTNRSYLFRLYNDAGTCKLWFHTSADGITSPGGEVNWAPSTGTWYHVAAVYDASAGSVAFYVNGSQQGVTQTGLATSLYDNATNFAIGANYANDGSPTEIFDGKMDDVRLWDDIRTSTEISTNYQRELAGNEANLQGYWKLNNDYDDETANSNDLTPSGLPVFSTDVPFADTTTTSTSTTTTSTSTSITTTSTSTTTTSTSTTATSTSTTTTSTSTTTTSTSTTSTSTTTTSTSTTTTMDFRFVVEKVK